MTTSNLSRRAFLESFCTICVLSTIALFATIATAQERNNNPSPTFANVPYGTHERHVLDFWKAESDTPTPVVIFIHGGGFTGGTKDGVKEEMLKDLLAAKISVAAIHYRLLDDAPLPAAHDDAVQALQFLRSKHAEWNIDKTRTGAFGSSAGAQLCMYLAFHDDRADPESTDPLARESSRLTCVAALRGQTTMNTELWLKWIPGYNAPHRDPYSIFDVKTKTEYLKKVSEVSALDLVSADDPPIYMKYKMAPGDPLPENPKKVQGWKVHHVIFGVKLKEKMDALGVEADLEYPGAETTYESMTDFFIQKLAKREADETKIGFSFSKRESELDILLDGKPIATYVWSDPKTTRPYFKQIKAAGGEVQLTRNHPPQDGDFDDHQTYHPGIWWGFGDVGGNDYWRMKARIIGGQFTQEPTVDGSSASFAIRNKLLNNQGDKTFCEQNCRYTFLRREQGILMICESAFVRDASDFWLGDQEEMGLAFRVATSLTTKKGGTICDSEGRTDLKQIRTSQSDWCDYSGAIMDKSGAKKYGGLMLMNDPKNFRKPWWHAVDTGLLVANPLGESELTGNGKKRENVLVKKGEPFRLRYGCLIHMDNSAAEFDAKKAFADFLSVMEKPVQ